MIAFVLASDAGHPVFTLFGATFGILGADVLLQIPPCAATLRWRFGVGEEFFCFLGTVVRSFPLGHIVLLWLLCFTGPTLHGAGAFHEKVLRRTA